MFLGREFYVPRNDPTSKVRGALGGHVQSGPALDVVFESGGLRVIEILVPSKSAPLILDLQVPVEGLH